MRTLISFLATVVGSAAFQMSVDAGYLKSYAWAVPWVWALCTALWTLWLVMHEKVHKEWLRSFHERIGLWIIFLRIALVVAVFFSVGYLAKGLVKKPTSNIAVVGNARPQQPQPDDKSTEKAQPPKKQGSTGVQQQSKGNNSPNQNSSGNNSPNINGNQDVGINNGTVIYNTDPETSTMIKKLLELQGEKATSRELLARYPLGYAIFDVDSRNRVSPYSADKVLNNYELDWSAARVLRNTPNEFEVQLPDIYPQKPSKPSPGSFSAGPLVDCKVGGFKKVGRVPVSFSPDEGIEMLVEVLATDKNSIVFVIGFRQGS